MGNACRIGVASAAWTVHPHAHGERWYRLGLRTGVVRFIPTHMGNATRDTLQQFSLAVHPHAHGERARTFRQEYEASGSSPRTWGTLQTAPEDPLSLRFIPTHMGNALTAP